MISVDQRESVRPAPPSADQRGASINKRGSVRINQHGSAPISADQHPSAGISSEIFHRSPGQVRCEHGIAPSMVTIIVFF